MQDGRISLAALVLLSCLPALADPKAFVPNADAQRKLDEALALAQKSHRRLFITYGGSWCTACAAFEQTLEKEPNISRYVTLRLDSNEFEALQQYAKTKRIDLKPEKGPLITILETDGAQLELLDAGRIAPARIKDTLNRWVLGPPAEEVLRTALPRLKQSGKAGWVEFRADWCGWCRKMEAFFSESDAAPILQKYYTVISIDEDKNTGAHELEKKLGEKSDGGIPWFAVVDPQGKPLADSEGPKGNIGFPDNDVERTHFLSVLRRTAKGITGEEVELVSKALAAK